MAFNINTAKPLNEEEKKEFEIEQQKNKFDITTARPLTFVEKQVDEVKEFGRDVFTEQISPVLSGLSTAALGIPKAILPEKARETIFPEQRTTRGKLARAVTETLGFTAGGAAKIARAVGKAIIPNVSVKGALGLGRQIARAVAARKKAVLVRNALRGGTEAATFGALQKIDPAEDFSIGGQLKQAAGFAVLGAAIPVAARPIVKAVKTFRKFKTPSKTPAIKTVTEKFKEGSKGKRVELVEAKNRITSVLQEQENLIKGQATKTKRINIETGKKELTETTNTLKQNVKILENNLQKSAEVGSQEFQKELPKFYRANSKGYGKQLDKISDDLVTSGERITIGETDQIITNVLKEADDALITDGRARQAVEALKQKYSVNLIGNEAGRITSNAGESIPFKQLVTDLKDVKLYLSLTMSLVGL
jgi:hypothetical protein